MNTTFETAAVTRFAAPATTPSVAVIGAGYVGLPLAAAFAAREAKAVCIDPALGKISQLNAGISYIDDVPTELLQSLVESGLLRGTTEPAAVAGVDAIFICVPTPLSRNREPDLTYVEAAARAVAPFLRRGQLVVLESTTYPGTTREIVKPILEGASGLRAGSDFHLAMSPERIDPGRSDFTIETTPKVIGGFTPACAERAAEVYGTVVNRVCIVSTPEAAELTKLLENIFRSVNIALVNELAMLCDRMGIDVWEVTEAAATKPFGFMSFKPGPGLGGHCIPLDPFYLSWKAREVDFYTEFIELAGKVNENMPRFCAQKVQRALNDHSRSVRGSRILILGVAYKADIDDTRESPALKLIELLVADGAKVDYHDPHVADLIDLGLSSVPLDDALAHADCTVIVTAHSSLDYGSVVERSRLVVDLRNATRGQLAAQGKIVKL
jgi:UDP-N-acetyl-D-glucosamine dehydrogenase